MRLHVPLDLVRATEALAADRAAVGFLPGVNPHVHLQMSHLRKAFAADLAAERLLSRVAALVLLQPARRVAALPTNAASVWLFSGVHLNVNVQMSYVTERLSTDFTAERCDVTSRRLLMGAVCVVVVSCHCRSLVVTHVRSLPPGGRVTFGHAASVLHAGDIDVFVIGTVGVDGGERLRDGVGRRLNFADRVSVGHFSLTVF